MCLGLVRDYLARVRDFSTKSLSWILEGREMLAEAVTLNGLSFLPSNTNFMFVDLNNLNAEAFRKAMEEEKILVRGIHQDYTQWSRVSTGLIGDVSKYIQALPKVLEKISSL